MLLGFWNSLRPALNLPPRGAFLFLFFPHLLPFFPLHPPSSLTLGCDEGKMPGSCWGNERSPCRRSNTIANGRSCHLSGILIDRVPGWLKICWEKSWQGIAVTLLGAAIEPVLYVWKNENRGNREKRDITLHGQMRIWILYSPWKKQSV